MRDPAKMTTKKLGGDVRPLSYLLSDDGENMMRLAGAAPLAIVEVTFALVVLGLCAYASRRLRDQLMLADYVVHGILFVITCCVLVSEDTTLSSAYLLLI